MFLKIGDNAKPLFYVEWNRLDLPLMASHAGNQPNRLENDMTIKPLVFTLMAAQFITTAMLFCGTVSAMDDLGPTNLQKIAMALKENQEIQRKDLEKRKNNVVLAREFLKNCDKISDAGERATCERKYQSLVKSSIHVCGADCQ